MNLPFASPADAVRTVPGTPDPLLGALAKVQSIERVGRVAEAHGTLIRATGLKAAIGELCVLRNPPGAGDPPFRLSAEVVGVSKQQTLPTTPGVAAGIPAPPPRHPTAPP